MLPPPKMHMQSFPSDQAAWFLRGSGAVGTTPTLQGTDRVMDESS